MTVLLVNPPKEAQKHGVVLTHANINRKIKRKREIQRKIQRRIRPVVAGVNLFDCLLSVLDYLKLNSLLDKLQLSINPEFIKLQFIFAMGQGLVITLCKDRHIEVINECISDLFHLDYIR